MKNLTTTLLLLIAATSSLHAQAPTSIAGVAFGGQATAGGGSFAPSGYFILLPDDYGSSFQLIGISGITDLSASCSYSYSGQFGYLAISYQNASTVMTLDFQTSTSGSYYVGSGANYQEGTFGMASGQAANSVASQSVYVVPELGALPFSSTGSGIMKVSAAGNTYTLDGQVGGIHQYSSGTCSYTRLNRSTGMLQINDSVTGSSTAYMASDGPITGVYAIRQPYTGGYQIGAYTILDTRVAISYPTRAASYATPLSSIDIAGSAVDNMGVAQVSWSNNQGVSGIANGTTSWSAPGIPLQNGFNQITITVLDTVGNTAQTTLLVNRVPPTRIIKLSAPASFGSVAVGGSVQEAITIFNIGNSTLTVSNLSFPGGFSGDWSGGIAAQSWQAVPVTFSPSAQTAYSGTVSVASDATGGTSTINLTGTGYFPLTNSWTLWWQNTSGVAALWQITGSLQTLTSYLNPAFTGTGWPIVGTADFDNNGHDDLLFQSIDGRLAVWFMDGADRQSTAYLTPRQVAPAWHVVATGDMNGDGQKDIIFQDTNGFAAVWLMNGLVATQTVRLNPTAIPTGWRIVGAQDFNGDNQTDLLLQNINGRVAVWFMNGVQRIGSAYLNPLQSDPHWRVVGTKDLNGDGYPGIIWQQDSGVVAYWQMDGTNCVHAGRLGTADPAWRVVGPH